MSEPTKNIDAELRKIVEGFGLKYIPSQKKDTAILIPTGFSLFWSGFNASPIYSMPEETFEGVRFSTYDKKELLTTIKNLEQDLSDPKKAKEKFANAIKHWNVELIDYMKDKLNIKDLTDKNTMKQLITMAQEPAPLDVFLLRTISILLRAGVPFTKEDQKLLDDLSKSNTSYPLKERFEEINNIVKGDRKNIAEQTEKDFTPMRSQAGKSSTQQEESSQQRGPKRPSTPTT